MNIIFCEIVTLYIFYTTLSGKVNFKLRNNREDLMEQNSAQVHNNKRRKRDSKQDKDPESNDMWIDQVFNYVISFLGFEVSKITLLF